MTERSPTPSSNRRGFLGAGAGAAALAAFGISPALAAEAAGRSDKPLKAAFSNAGLQATWCAQGKQAAEYWGKLFNVEVTWFDGELERHQAARRHRQHGLARNGISSPSRPSASAR